MTNKQIEAVPQKGEEGYGFHQWLIEQQNMPTVFDLIEALKDAHPYITDDAIRARVGELIMKVEG